GEYIALVSGFAILLLIPVAFIHVHGTYMFPPGFDVIRHLFHGEYALLGGALLATLLYLLAGDGIRRFARGAGLITLFLGALWMALWVLVHRVFGIELTPSIVADVLINQAPMSEMGVTPIEV